MFMHFYTVVELDIEACPAPLFLVMYVYIPSCVQLQYTQGHWSRGLPYQCTPCLQLHCQGYTKLCATCH